jgi:hypothetical protein
VHRRPTLLAAGALLVGLLAAPAADANFIAAGPDARGDAADASPGRDIAVVALSYDRRRGMLRGGVALRGAPDDAAKAFVSLLAGTRTATGCDGAPAISLSSFTTDALARWTRFDAAGPPAAAGDARKERAAGELQKFEVSERALAGHDLDCVTAVLTDPADPHVVYDSAGPFAFEPLPELAARLAGPRSALRPGQTRTVGLTLRNPGDAATRRIRVSVGRARGLTARAPRFAAALRAGQRRTVPIRVSLSRRAKTTTPLKVTATAGRLRVRADVTLSLVKPPPPGGDGGDGSSVCASYAPVLGGIGSIVTFPC